MTSTSATGTTTAKVFLLSGTEMGLSSSYFIAEGAVIEYFSGAANSKRIGYLDGSAKAYWLRTPGTSSSYAIGVSTSGAVSRTSKTTKRNIRPTFILPYNALFNDETLVLEGVA